MRCVDFKTVHGLPDDRSRLAKQREVDGSQHASPLQALPKMKVNDGVFDLCKLLDEAQVRRYVDLLLHPAAHHACYASSQPLLTLQGTSDKEHIKGSGVFS